MGYTSEQPSITLGGNGYCKNHGAVGLQFSDSFQSVAVFIRPKQWNSAIPTSPGIISEFDDGFEFF
jgi:hypothetical protein